MNTLSGTNIAAINAISNGNYAHKKISSSLERLSSGTRVNSYGDNITTALAHTSANSQIGAISSDVQNVNETLSMLRIADKALEDQIRILNKVRAKAVQASSDGLNKRDRSALQNEIRLLFDDLDDIAQQTTYKGKKLLTGEYKNKNISLGSKTNEQYRYSIDSSQSDDIGYVRYETTNGGSRNIDNLSLNFKEIGSNKEDVRLDPFILSSTAGRTLKDLANHVNASTNRLGGVRAIYKEGIAPTKIDAKRVDTYKKLLNNKTTTSFYEEKDFEYVDYSKKVKKIEGVTPIKRENFTFKSPTLDVVEDSSFESDFKLGVGEVKTSLPKEMGKGSETLVSPLKRENKKSLVSSPDPKGSNGSGEKSLGSYAFPSGTMGTRETSLPEKMKPVVGARDIPYSPTFRATATGGPFLEDTATNDGHIGNKIKINLESKIEGRHIPSSIGGTYDTPGLNTANSISVRFSGGTILAFFTAVNSTHTSETVNVAGTPLTIKWLSTNKFELISTDTALEVVLSGGGNSTTINTSRPFPNNLTVTTNNLPAGLGFNYTIARDFKTLDMALTSFAPNNNAAHSINNLEFSFLGDFEGGVTPTTAKNIGVTFIDPVPRLTIDEIVIPELATNVGSINKSLVITIAGSTLGADPENKLSIFNLPVGVTWSAVKVDATHLRIDFTGKAFKHADVDDINNVTFEFDKSFAQGNTTNITELKHNKVNVINGVKVNFTNNVAPVADMTPKIFKEALANDGNIINRKAVIDLKDRILKPAPYLFADGISIPDRTAKMFFNFSVLHSTTLEAFNMGSLVRSTMNLPLTKTDKSGLYTVPGQGGRNFQVELKSKGGDNYDIYLIDNGGGLREASETLKVMQITAWDGADNRVTLNPLAKTNRQNITDFPDISNYQIELKVEGDTVPAGLSISYKLRADGQNIDVELSGTANPHENANDVNNIRFSFIGTFTGGVTPTAIDGIAVDFIAVPPTLTIDKASIGESAVNDGTVNDSVIITMAGDTLGANPERNLIIANLPVGVTWTGTRTSDTTFKVDFTGKAYTHDNTNSINNITFEFDKAFANANVFDITELKNAGNNVRTSVALNFIDNPDPVVTIDSKIFSEVVADDGNIRDRNVVIDLGAKTLRPTPYLLAKGITLPDALGQLNFIYSHTIGDYATARAGAVGVDWGIQFAFTPVGFKDKSTIFPLRPWLGAPSGASLEIKARGGNKYDIYLLDPTGGMLNGAGETIKMFSLREGATLLSPATEAQKENIPNFPDLREGFLDLKVEGDTVPVGLSISYKLRADRQTVDVELSGTANPHLDTNDVDNIKFSFSGFFEGGVTPATVSGISVDFISIAPIAKIRPIFKEKMPENMGAIGNTATINLGDDVDAIHRYKHESNIGPTTVVHALQFGTTTIIEQEFVLNTDYEFTLAGDVYTIRVGKNHAGDGKTYVQSDKIIPLVLMPIRFGVVAGGGLFGTVRFHEYSTERVNPGIATKNLPLGFTPAYTFPNTSEVIVTLNGMANALSHENRHDVINLEFSFTGAFSGGVAPATITDASIDFKDSFPVLELDTHIFSEALANNGSIQIKGITLSVSNGQFIDVLTPGLINVSNVPIGLTPVFTRLDASHIVITLDGRAISHTDPGTENKVDLEFSFANTLVKNHISVLNDGDLKIGGAGDVRETIEVKYIENNPEQATISPDIFSEKIINDGGIVRGAHIIDLHDKVIGTRSDFIDGVYNIGRGSADRMFLNGLAGAQITIPLVGAGGANEITVSGITITHLGGTRFRVDTGNTRVAHSFNLGKINAAGTSISVPAVHPAIPRVPNLYVTSPNLPSGLVIDHRVKANGQDVEITLIGRASKHIVDRNDIIFSFSGDFSHGVPSKAITGVKIDFISPILTINHHQFSERIENNGAISNVLTLNLSQGQFVTIIDGKISLIGVPDNLVRMFDRKNASNIEVTLTGMAITHTTRDNLDTIGKYLRFDFEDDLIAFNREDLNAHDLKAPDGSDVREKIEVLFLDSPPGIVKFESSFSETLINKGTIKNRVTIDLGDRVDVATFVPDFQGIPDGLALSYSFLPGNNKILVHLSGEAVSHRASASIDDLTFSFSGNFSTGVHPITAKDGKIEFIDPILSLDRLSFTERAENDGKIDIALNLTITNAVFNDTADKNIALRGVPNGLEATFDLTNLSNIQVNLIGRAISHQFLDSLNNLFFDFADTNIRNNVPDINFIHINTDLPLLLSNSNRVITKNIEITFEDNIQPRTTISGVFSEVDKNNGTIRKELTINLNDDYYSKPMITTDVRTKAPGLSAIFTHINTSQIVVELVGTAIDHRDEDDVDLLNFTFTGGEFSAGFPALDIDDASIDFLDPELEIDGDTFSESFTRAGIIETTLNLHVTFGVFEDDIFEKISLTDVPAGLKVNFHRESDTDIEITLQDIALSHADEDDNDGLRNPFLHLNFRNNLIKLNKTNLNSLPVAFNGADVKDSIIIDFLDGGASLKTSTFTESELENDGSISNTITLSFDTDIVATINNADITLNRLPDNLTVSYVVKQAEREIIVSLSGQALKHTNSDDVDDLFFSFTRNVLKNGVQMDNLSGVSIDYFDMDIIPSSTTFYESRADIGSIETIINLSITGNKIKDGIGFNALQDLISASSLPNNLSTVFRQLNASNIEVRLINEALLHDTAQNITNLTFSFAHTLFETPTKHQTVDNMHIDFFTRPSIEIDPTDVFSEQDDDVGNIDNAITFKLSGDRFSSIGNNKLGDYIEVKNVPANLSIAYRLISPQKIEVTLKGNALSHENTDDVDNLLFSFDSAIVVNNSTISELQAKIDFFDIPILLANEKFVESVKNDGSIRRATTINIVEGTQFSNVANQARWDELISIDNLPNNLSARYELVADSNNLKLEVSLINNALFHGDSNDVDNLVFNFNREAFKGGVYNIKANTAIDFYDEPLITLSPSLVESFDNDGSIGNEAIFLLKGDTWNVKEDFSYTNVAFSADLLEIEKIIVDGVDILNNRNPMTLTDVVQQMGYNTNGVGVTTNNGKQATIYAAKDGGSLVFYSNEIEAGDSINVKFKLEGYGFDNIDLLKDNPAINHSFGGDGSINPEDVSRYITSSKIPVGLSPSFTYIDSTRIKVKLEGNTPDAKQIDVRALFSFDSILLNYGIPANEASGLVDFIDRATLSLNPYTFSESRVVQGKVDTVIELSVLGDGFIDEKNAIDGGYFQINGLPNGLIASFAVGVADDDKINVTLSGVAVSHKITDNLTNLSLRINPLAFSSTLNAVNDKGESSNIVENISLTFLEEVIITADDKSFFESFGNDGSIRNKVTFNIEGGAELKQIEKTLKYGFSIDLANAKEDGFIIIDGKRFDDFDSSDNLQVIARKLSNSLNGGGVGSFIHEEIIYGKPSGSFLLILKERSDGVIVGGRLGNTTVLPSPSLSIKDKTVILNDLAFNINDEISFNLADFSGLVPNFTPLSPTQIVMELNGAALSHTKADLSLNIDVEFSSGLFDILPSNFDATNKPRQKVNILFLDTATLAVSGKFKETNKNKGEINNLTDAVTVKFTNDKIVSGLSNDAISRYITIKNLPAGLTPSYLIHADKDELIINLDNKALSHDIADSVDSIEVVFDKDMFVSKSSFDPIKNIELDFIEASIITASPITFQEAESNTGLIENSLTLTVENGELRDIVRPAGILGGLYNFQADLFNFIVIDGDYANPIDMGGFVGNAGFLTQTSAPDAGGTTYTITHATGQSYNLTTTGTVKRANSVEAVIVLTLTPLTINTVFGAVDTREAPQPLVLNKFIDLKNVPTGLSAEYSYIDNKHIEVILSSTVAGGISGATKHSSADDLHNLRFEFKSGLLSDSYIIEDIRNISIDFGTNLNIVALNNVFSEEFYSNNGFIDRTITLEVQGGDIKNNIKNFSFASRIDDTILRDIAENGLLKIDNIDLADKTKGRYYIDNKIRDFTTGTAKEQSKKRAYHIASVINNGYEGTVLANGDKLFANVVENGATYEVYLLKNTTTSVMLDTYKITNSFANDNTADPSVRAMIMPDKDSNLDGYAAYINVPLGLTPKFKALTKNLIEVELRGNAFSHLVIEDDHNKTKGNQLEFNFSPHAFIDALYVSHAGGIDVSFVDNKINNEVSFLEANFKPGTISAPYVITFDNGILNPGLNLDINISADNVPEGLIPTYSYIAGANNKLEISFKGKVDIEHRPEHNVDDLTFHFNRALFDEGAGSATTRGVGKITYINQPVLDYPPTVIREKPTNAGHIQQTINIHISDGVLDDGLKDYFGNFVDARLTSLISAGVPLGLGTSWHIVNSSNIQLTLEGFAISHTPGDSSGIRYDFNDIGIMKGSVVAGDISYNTVTKDGLYLSFVGQNTFKDMGDFIEVDANTGAISNTLNIEISEGGGIANEHYIGKVLRTNNAGENLITVENLPTGLTPIFTRGVGEIIIVSLTGIASKRDRADSTDINFTFHNDLMSLGLASDVISNVDIKFIDVVHLSFNHNKFVEHSDNNGTFKFAENPFGKATITLSGGVLSNGGHHRDIMEKRLQDNIAVNNLGDLGGLFVSFKYIDNTHVEVYLRGVTPSHKSPDHDLDNVNGLTFSFKSLLFVDEPKINLSEPIAVDFINQAKLAIRAGSIDKFQENATSNLGEIVHTGNVIIQSVNDVNFVHDIVQVNANVSYINLPKGLNAEFEFVGVGFSNVVVKLTGKAENHNINYNVNNLQFEFKGGAFEDSISSTSPKLSIDFEDNVQLAPLGRFVESVNNDGSIANRVIVEIEGDVEFDLTRVPVATDITINNEPIGLDYSYRIVSPKNLEIELKGKVTDPNNHGVDDNIRVAVTFNDVLFAGGGTRNANVVYIPIDFVDPPVIELVIDSVNSGKFKEGLDDDGSIENEITFRISNGIIDDGIDINSLITPINMSPDYQASFRVGNASTIIASLKGQSILNDRSDNSNDLDFSFDGAIFKSGVRPLNLEDIIVEYRDAGKILKQGSFEEDGLNVGVINEDKKVTITLLEDTFKGDTDSNGVFKLEDDLNINTYTTLFNIPAGYRYNAIVTNDKTIVLTLLGNANKHHSLDSINNMSLSFNRKEMFTSGVSPENVNRIELKYIDYVDVTVDGHFIEATANDGSLTADSKTTISLAEGWYSTVADIGSMIKTNFVPVGLIPKYEISPSKRDLIVSFDGQAELNAKTDSRTVEFSFINTSLFRNEIVPDKVKAKVNFFDTTNANYIGKFIESNRNIGTFEGSEIIVSLDGDTFKGDVINLRINGLPDKGLTADARRISDNTLAITILGEVKDPTKRSTINNTKVSVDFLNPANFRSNALPKTLIDIPLEFVNSPNVTTTGKFIETAEDVGKVGGKLLLTLNDDTFKTGEDTSNLVTISYADRELDGLSIEASFKNSTQMELSFSGTGVSHNERDVPFDIKFDPALFTKGVALEPQKSTVQFIKKGDLKLANNFIESLANNGSIRNNLTLNIENGFFSNTDDINDYAKIDNLPLGITSEFSFVNIHTLEVSFAGNALSHKVENSLNDIKISLGKEIIKNEVPLSIDNIQLDFIDAPILTYDKIFNEAKLDNGSIDNGINVTISRDKIKDGFDPAQYMKASYTDKDGIKINTLPDGLSFQSKVISDNRFILSLKGTSTNHAAINSINDLEITIDGAFLEDGVSPLPMNNIKIKYADTPTYKLEPIEGFVEALEDVGAISNKVTINIEGDEFNSNVDASSYVNITNIPIGLSLSFTVDKFDNSKLILELTGNARLHSKDDTANIRIDFLEGLFRKRVPISAVSIPVVFNTSNSFTVKSSFIEDISNNGAIKEPIFFELNVDKMRNVNPTPFIKVNNLPDGLLALFSVEPNLTTLRMTLVGAADKHSSADSTTNDNVLPIRLDFDPGLFENKIAAKPLNVVHIRFIDPPVVNAKGSFIEDYINDGSIDTAITFIVENDLFSTKQDIGPLIEATGLPEGLSVEYKSITENRIIASLTGRADKHTTENNTKVGFNFKSKLFNQGLIPPPVEVDLKFDSIRPAFLKVEGELKEDIQNDGSIVTSIIVNVLDDVIADNYKFPFSMIVDDIRALVGQTGDADGKSTFTLDGVLFEGITIEEDSNPLTDTQIINDIVEKINNEGSGTNGLYAELTLDKAGLPHLNILKHVEDRAVTVSGSAGGNTALENHYNFEDAGYKKRQIELGLDPNNAGLAADLTVAAREVKTEYMLSRLIFDKNLPDGLRSKFTFIDNKRILVEINGKAFKHGKKDSIDDYTLTFTKEAFKKKLAPEVLDDIPIKFQNPAIKYQGKFEESEKNDGSITGALTLFLTGDEFKDDIDEQLLNGFFAINNLPDGLFGDFTIEAKNIVRFELRGNAKEHAAIDTITNMSVSFNQKLFKNGVAADKIEPIPVTFIDSVASKDSGGGSGTKGGYITFISPRGDNLNISAGGADFGVEGIEHQSTVKLLDVFNNQFSTNELYSIGDEYNPYLTQLNGGYGAGVTSKESASVFLDTVDAAISELNQTRQRLASFYQRIQQAGEVLSVEKINLKSANSRLVNIDFAEESAQFNRADILSKAASFALTQANSLQREKINSLLDGVK